MADNTADDGCLGFLGSAFATLVLGALLIQFLQWLWGLVVAVAIWLWLAPGRLVAWILSWPWYSGHLLLGLLATAVMVVALWLLVELVLRLIWPSQFVRASNRASRMMQGLPIRRGEEVMLLDFVEFCDPLTNTASLKLYRCTPERVGRPDCGIRVGVVEEASIPVHPDQVRLSRRVRTLRQSTRTYLESLKRRGLEPLASDSIEAKAWRALMDAQAELAKLMVLRKTARSMLKDAQRVQEFSADNELLATTRQRSLTLIPKLKEDIGRIDARCLELHRFGYKLYEFLNIPRTMRSLELSDNMEATLLAQRGMSDELFEEIKLIEEAYGELILE